MLWKAKNIVASLMEWSHEGRYCWAPVTHKATLGCIVECLRTFHNQPQTLLIPSIPEGSFEKKLYSMYLSYLPSTKVKFELNMKIDDWGSFTELLKSSDHGQISVNISKPGITKGQHWHNIKWEFFHCCFRSWTDSRKKNWN